MNDPNRDKFSQLLNSVKHKNYQALAKLLTMIDSIGPEVLTYPEFAPTEKSSFRLGITGPPGAGKSTLIGSLIHEFRKKNLTVGVLAVDPSSPFTKGAILGDRIRYSEHFSDEHVYIRSIGTRGSLGGLSASAYLMLRAFDQAQFDVVIIETVGVGQTELEIINVADYISVLLVPESGDSIQAMKAGLLEIAQDFVVNKCDRPGADGFTQSLKAYAGDIDKVPLIFKTTATDNIGTKELAQHYMQIMSEQKKNSKRSTPEKLQAEAKSLLKYQLELKLDQNLTKIQNFDNLKTYIQSEIQK